MPRWLIRLHHFDKGNESLFQGKIQEVVEAIFPNLFKLKTFYNDLTPSSRNMLEAMEPCYPSNILRVCLKVCREREEKILKKKEVLSENN